MGGQGGAVQQAREKRESLFPRRLESSDMGVWTIDRFCLLVSWEIWIGVWKDNYGWIDGVGQSLVKESSLKDAQGLEEMLDQHIIIFRSCRLQAGIAYLYRLWGRVRIRRDGRYLVLVVGPRDAHSESEARIRVLFDLVLQLDARQNIQIVRAAIHWLQLRKRLRRYGLIHFIGRIICICRLKADSGLQSGLPEANGVHQVAGVDTLVQVPCRGF